MDHPTTPVSNPARISRWAWLLFPLLALAFAAVTTAIRARRIDYVSDFAGGPASAAPWQPRMVVPGQHNESFEWMDQTRQMFMNREWRVRYIDYENALGGREVYAASPYRWWLGFLALCRHWVARAHLGPSIEWAAMYADPLLLLLAFGLATVVFVARRFGFLAAGLASVALATLFPFASGFTPGVPDDNGLAQACIIWSVLPILAGAGAQGPGSSGSARRWLLAGGITGGVGLWISVSRELPILLGIGLGALLAAGISRRAARAGAAAGGAALPWRVWGLAGGVTCLAAYLLEFFPSHMGNWEFRAVHPIFGLAWLGGAELLARATTLIAAGRSPVTFRGVAGWAFGAAAFLALPAAMGIGHNFALLSIELPTMRLSLLPGGAAAPNLWAWLLQNGFTAQVWATLLPLLIVIPSGILLLPRMAPAALRVPVALALGPVVVAVALAVRQINWWNGADAALLVLLVSAAGALRAAPRPRLAAWLSAVFAAAILLPGVFQLWPPGAGTSNAITETEVVGLVERDLAYSLAKRVGSAGAVVLAPPNVTATLYYYSGLKGLATFGWEDRDGFQAAVRIVSSTTPEEAQELIGLHGVTHIIIPSWDPFMDAYAQIGEGQVAGTFLERLHQWNLPWLRPVTYLVPVIPGFEGQTVTILEVVDEQDDATALGRTAVYLVDIGRLDLAQKAGEALRRFPADLGALVARAQVEVACGEGDDFAKSADLLVRRIATGADRDLQWDQRVGLAIVLVQAHRLDLALPRLKACLAEIDEEKLRATSTILLYRLQVLRKALKLEISDPALRSLSLDLLPPDLRSRVE